MTPHAALPALALLLAGGGGALWAQQSGRAAPATPPAAPQRVVSLNLCADQLLLALADRDRIAGLTRNATDPGMSAAAAAARGLPLIRNAAEQILVAAPDLVIGMPASGSAAVAALPRGSFRTLDLPTADSFDVIRRTIRLTATALGHPARGEALIARMERDLAGVPRPGRGRVAAYYQRRGYMTGTGTLIDEMMGRVGLVNLAAKLGKPPLSQLSLEEMVAANPDFLIVESASDTITDQGSEMLHHPALRGIPRLSVPEAWTVCGGPAYGAAVHRLAGQIQRHDGARR